MEKHADGLPKLLYERLALGLLFSEREMVIKFERVEHGNGWMTFNVCSVDHPDYPEGDHAVRMKVFKRSNIKQVGDDLHFSELTNMSMGGYIPASLFNMMIGSLAKKGMDELMKKLEKYK